MSFKPFLAILAMLSLANCHRLSSPASEESAATSVMAAAADMSVPDAGAAEDDEDESWVENVSLPADATPPPKARDFAKGITVLHRKSPYFEVTLDFRGDFRPYPEAFAALYHSHHDSLDAEFQTYGGRDGQSDQSMTTVTLDAVSPRLLIVSVSDWGYYGGAHGDGQTHTEYWDRKAKAFIKADDIFDTGHLPNADAYACKQFKDQYSTSDPEESFCGDNFQYNDFGGATGWNGRITGVDVITRPSYAAGDLCAVVPYRLFKSLVKPEWQDQFTDDTDFEAHTKDAC